MATVYDANPGKLVDKASQLLEKETPMPDWAKFVKTGQDKERPPEDPKWWYKRAAAVLRSVYIYGPIGTNKLRVKYGSKKHRGARPEEFRRGAGKIIRTILQQLQKAGYVENLQKGVHKGRKITSKGKSFLDKISKECKS